MSQNRSHAVMAQRSEPHEIVSRAEAKAAGIGCYFTGVPCRAGHIAKRNVANWTCRMCENEKAAARRARDLDGARAKDRQRYHATGERKLSQMRASRAAHVEERREYDRRRYHENPARRAAQFAQVDRWWRANKGKRNEYTARRRSWIKRATPLWLTDDDWKQIKAIYREAAAREGDWHVDHITPLRGKTVCGLHVPSNLQILPGDENRRKRNAFVEA